MDDKKKDIISQRSGWKRSLNNLKRFAENLTEDVSLQLLQVKLERLENIYASLEESKQFFEEPELIYYDELDETYDYTKGMFLSKLKPLQTNKEKTYNPKENGNMHSHLPIICLKSFSGEIEEFPEFIANFSSLVGDRKLSNVDKLHYLKSSLKGEPLNLVNKFSLVEENYEIALKTLKSRYENKRIFLSHCFSKLLNTKSLKKEDGMELKALIDEYSTLVHTVSQTASDEELWNFMIAYIIESKLDDVTRKDWEQNTNSREMSTLKNLFKFLDSRCQALEVISKQKESSRTEQVKDSNYRKRHTVAATTMIKQEKSNINVGNNCVKCQGRHKLTQCSEFKLLTPHERFVLVKDKKICINCLNFGHKIKDCRFKPFCIHCNNYHHSLLHLGKEKEANTSDSKLEVPKETIKEKTVASHSTYTSRGAVLPTAMLLVSDNFNNFHPCRALLDNCSQSNFITEEMVNLMKLNRQASKIKIIGIGNSPCGISKGIVTLTISSYNHNFRKIIQALIVPKITKGLCGIDLPLNVDIKIDLADPKFGQPGEIDLLLGVGVVSEIFIDGKITDILGNLVAQNTLLGYVIMGECNEKTPLLSTHTNFTSLENILKRFWELNEINESFDSANELSKESGQNDEYCETHFVNTHRRDEEGKYIVQLPFCNSPEVLGDSYSVALKRFISLERRLSKDPELYKQYRTFINEYVELGHAKILGSVQENQQRFFIPHHCVIRESSHSTKLRVVFDGSCKCDNGVSLNDILCTGEKLHNDLSSVLLRFRQYRFVFIADIEKMFRMIWVDESHQPFQCILWRNDPSSPIQIIQLKTVTYGLRSSPFLANRVVKDIFSKETKLYEQFYVDDILTGADSLENARNIQDTLIKRLSSSGMKLRKWASNCRELIEHLPSSELLSGDKLISDDDNIRTLGIRWKPLLDQFCFTINFEFKDIFTKRSLLSSIARIYDPLGWLAPLTVVAKLFMQELWKCSLSWDEEIPSELLSRCIDYFDSLNLLSDIVVPRYIFGNSIELHGFCDASSKAYAAVIYVKAIGSSGESICNLLCARTKAAPLSKPLTIPRLELSAAFLLAKLFKSMLNTLTCPISSIYAWSDSTIALTWIMNDPGKYKIFVSHRIKFIQSVLDKTRWFHVCSKENPADHASRGINAKRLLELKLWWHGPSWIITGNYPLDRFYLGEDNEANKEEKKLKISSFIVRDDSLEIIKRYSSLHKLISVVGWIRRFILNTRLNIQDRRNNQILSILERNEALITCIRIVQKEYFTDIFKQLPLNERVTSHSNLRKLSLFLDKEGLIRVGGRLNFGTFKFDKKHPFLIPKSSHFTDILIRYYHIVHLHAGPQLLLSLLRDRFWILNGRNSVRRITRNCKVCFKFTARTEQQIMADLPKYRLESIRPFYKVGVDYAGPFTIKASKFRTNKTLKAYVCLFICLEIKAVHIELVTELTSSAFLSALRRFVSRRSKPVLILSDCGTNFIGASIELKRFLESLTKDSSYNHAIVEMGIEWKLNPPRAPHFGGIWESGIKAMKYHLKRVISDKLLDFEEFYTVLTQIESCMNSRPLTAMSSDPSDLSPLTPGHFLTGGPLERVPEPNFSDIRTTCLKRWKLLQHYVQQFWARWRVEYLNELQQRNKWFFKNKNIHVGDLVIIKEDNVPPNSWPLGRITEVFAGKDDITRVVNIKTSKGIIKRPIVKVILVPYVND